MIFTVSNSSYGKVMFLHLFVILFTGGGVSASGSGGCTPPGRHTPRADTATAVDGMHPTGMHSCYRPQRSWGKVMFLQASVILLTGGGVRGSSGGRAWFYLGGGMRGFIRGGAWFYSGGGGVRGFIRGGVRGFIQGGRAWFYSGGACVVLLGRGGVRGFIQGGGLRGFSSFCGYNEIRSMSGRYASYWNAFLFKNIFGFLCLLE